ncbi:MAG: hypothetical protein H6737_21560 [Alphaproteobacteria bacterium]|nr:hypothetical protein [Alphaproteobacteria bacterium]
MSVWIALSAALAADAPMPDIALATAVSGPVVLAGDTRAELAPFSKVREGDVLQLPADARLELVYFSDGHSETFAGPLDLVVGKPAEPVSRTEGDALVGEALRGLPALARRAELDKGGHTLVRGTAKEVPLDDDDRATLDAARKHYEALRAEAAEADVLPELYLATVYLEYSRSDDALGVLKSARERCGTCALPAQLVAWLEPPPSN